MGYIIGIEHVNLNNRVTYFKRKNKVRGYAFRSEPTFARIFKTEKIVKEFIEELKKHLPLDSLIKIFHEDELIEKGFTFDISSNSVRIIATIRAKNGIYNTTIFKTIQEAKKACVKELLIKIKELKKPEEPRPNIQQKILDIIQKPSFSSDEASLSLVNTIIENELLARYEIGHKKKQLSFYTEELEKIMPQSARFILEV